MSVRLFFLVWATSCFVQAPTHAQAQGPNGQAMPAAIAEIFTKANIPPASVGLLVQEVGAAEPLLAQNIDKPFNPASVIKLVTTYAGLELLGPAYAYKTEVYTAGELHGSTLRGDLVLKGYGDPKFTFERFNQLLRQLRDRGLREIRGDLILDAGFFEAVAHDPARFDGEPLRAYNVGPSALMVNFKTARFFFYPSLDGKYVAISPDVKPAQLEVVNHVKLSGEYCGDWRERIKLEVQTLSATQLRVTFTGSYPANCGEKVWNVSVLDHARFNGGLFASAWRELGGVWKGAVRLSGIPPGARLIATTESAPLAEMVRDINKYSNNVMARQVFLTLSAEALKQPGEIARSAKIVREWLAAKNIAAPELVLENGSGLSRVERISAQTLGSLLQAAWKSSVMPEFVSSLPLIGVDGTMRKRAKGESVAGNAHIKGGTLNDARAIAGYVLDRDGKNWIVVMLVNHPNAGATQAAQDALLQWVYARPEAPVQIP